MAALKGSPGPFVGLDIGAAYIKVVEASLSRGRVQVNGLGVFPTPAGLVDGNVVLDPQALGQEIRQFLSKNGISARRVVSSVAGQSSLVVRIIPVPKMTRAELAETMKWEIERQVPFPANETVWDFQPLTPPETTPDGENMQVLLAVAQEMLVNAHVETLQAAGLQPLAIDVEPLAASRALLDLDGAEGAAAGVVAVVDLGSISSDVSIFRDGLIHFTRTIPIAGRSFTLAIAEVTGQSPDTAERLKKDLAHVPEGLAPVAAPDYGPGFAEDFTFGDEPADFGPAETTAPPGAEDFAAGGYGAPPFEMGLPGQEISGEFTLDDVTTGEFTPGAPAPGGVVDESYLEQQVVDAITPILGDLVTELRRSLDYFRSNSGHAVERLILCGGTARLKGLDRFLSEQLGIPASVGDPMRAVNLSSKLEPQKEYVREVSPLFSVSLGLAVREMLTNGTKGK
jgi:type IV pilus assembly protein PilM